MQKVLAERILRAKEMLLRLQSQAASQKRFIAELERQYRDRYTDPEEADTKPHKTAPER
jgi:hypothetical protein